MANIVELREMSDDKLRELLENGREELFNLRFQKATAQLDNHARVKTVRREVAQVETVLHLRRLAIEAAAAEPEIAQQLADKQWKGLARYNYEESAWEVTLSDETGDDLATAWVNLNRKRVRGRRARARQEQPQLVIRHEIG